MEEPASVVAVELKAKVGMYRVEAHQLERHLTRFF